MNRVVEGLGIPAGEDDFPASARRLAEVGYAPLTLRVGRSSMGNLFCDT